MTLTYQMVCYTEQYGVTLLKTEKGEEPVRKYLAGDWIIVY